MIFSCFPPSTLCFLLNKIFLRLRGVDSQKLINSNNSNGKSLVCEETNMILFWKRKWWKKYMRKNRSRASD